MILIHSDKITARCNNDDYIAYLLTNDRFVIEILNLNIAVVISIDDKNVGARKCLNYLYVHNNVHISHNMLMISNRYGNDKLHKDYTVDIKSPIIYHLDEWRAHQHLHKKEI